MNLATLYETQKYVDEVIQAKTMIDINAVENVDKRVHAFKVELAEFSNEIGWFKYWKQSHVMDKAKTIEEFADCMAFLLSVGISRNYHTFIKNISPNMWSESPLDHLFLYLFENRIDSSGHWMNAFEQLICIGWKLGFKTDEMVSAYIKKSEKNILRQKEGY